MSSAETEFTPGSTGLTVTPETVSPPMPVSPNSVQRPSALSALTENHAELIGIDASLRAPTLLFFGSSIVWLLLGSALSLLYWGKLVVPHFLTQIDWLTVGRLAPAQQDAFAYGWIGSAGIGVGLWIMARLCRVPARHGGMLLAAWALWNLGLTLGIVGILNGEGTSVQWLEFPRYAAVVIFTAYSFISIWAVLLFCYRRHAQAYVSQWYLLAAFLWFPWIYATANLAVHFLPVQPAAKEIVHWWYVGSLFWGWFAPIALGTFYYVLPKTTHRPVHRYGLAIFGFWTLLLLSGWTGMVRLTGGPVPAWTVTVSIVATFALLLPISAISTNLLGSLRESPHAIRRSPSLRFVATGIYLFLFAGYLGVFTSLRTVSAFTHFTQVMVGQDLVFLAGFVSFVLIGAIYYITPKLVGHELASPDLVRWQFWLNVVGLGLMAVCLFIGGLLQGLGLEDAKIPSGIITNLLNPFLLTAGIGALLALASYALFAASFILLFVGAGRRQWALRPVAVVAPAPAAHPVAAVAPLSVP